jgi:hypothetical protein
MCIEISISLMASGLEAASSGTLSWMATAHTTTERTHLGFQQLVIAVHAHKNRNQVDWGFLVGATASVGSLGLFAFWPVKALGA